MDSKEAKILREPINAKDVQTGIVNQWPPETCLLPANFMLRENRLINKALVQQDQLPWQEEIS